MSPASKSKSKDKSASKAVKEQPKASSKPSSAPANSGNGVPASAYDPLSGTFHTLEAAPSAPLPAPQNNGRFQTIDETEEHSGSSLGTAAEYDSLSNNDSCSGESEDQKEKTASTTPLPEAIPGSDTDKRDKIRQKNEKKHQRQREKRAQELHERCSGYLMSRKLEALAQQLVAMGFSSERATMALILNEGRVEESVAWLFEGGIEGEHLNATNLDSGGSLKIDISDELAKITDMEVRFKCSKQDVERAIVSCEGDLEKAAETLKTQKQETSPPPKPEESGDPPIVNGVHMLSAFGQNPMARTQVKPVASVVTQQHRRDERDFNHTKAVASGVVSLESGYRNLQPLRRIQPKLEGTRLQVVTPAEKRWPSTSSSPSVSYSLGSSLQVVVPPTKAETRYVGVGSEFIQNNMQAGAPREPVIVMQRPQSINAKLNPSSTSVGVNPSPPVNTGWYPNGIATIDTTKVANGGVGRSLPSMCMSTSSPSPSLQQVYHVNQYQHFSSGSMDSGAAGWGGSWSATGTSIGTLSSLAAPPSLGLFTGWGSSGSSGSSSPVDWSTGGSMQQCDYTSIDWSLDSTPLRPNSVSSLKSDRLYDTWSTTFMGAKTAMPCMDGGVCIVGLQDGGLSMDSAGSHEWTSPFAGTDLFRLPRQFVLTSPSQGL